MLMLMIVLMLASLVRTGLNTARKLPAMVMCITCREVLNQAPPITGGWLLKLTTKLLTKETHGRFKLNGDERSKTGRNEKNGVY